MPANPRSLAQPRGELLQSRRSRFRPSTDKLDPELHAAQQLPATHEAETAERRTIKRRLQHGYTVTRVSEAA